MLPSFTSHESPGKSPAFRAAIETCETDTAWGEYFVHIGALREFPRLQQVGAQPVPHELQQTEAAPVTLRPEVAGTAITHSARYAAYDDAAEARRLAEARRRVDEARSAEEGNYEAAA